MFTCRNCGMSSYWAVSEKIYYGTHRVTECVRCGASLSFYANLTGDKPAADAVEVERPRPVETVKVEAEPAGVAA